MNEVEQAQFDEAIRQRDEYRSVLHKLESELCQSGAVWENSRSHYIIKDVLKDD